MEDSVLSGCLAHTVARVRARFADIVLAEDRCARYPINPPQDRTFFLQERSDLLAYFHRALRRHDEGCQSRADIEQVEALSAALADGLDARAPRSPPVALAPLAQGVLFRRPSCPGAPKDYVAAAMEAGYQLPVHRDLRRRGELAATVAIALGRPVGRPALSAVAARRDAAPLRASFTLLLWTEQCAAGLPCTPACRLCGLPTGGFCDDCGFPICSSCEEVSDCQVCLADRGAGDGRGPS